MTEKKKEQKAWLTYQVFTGGEDQGGAECLWLQSLFTLFIVVHTED